jgi:Flp pilus assembly protein TadD
MTPDSHVLCARAQRWASRGRYGDAEAAYREALRLVQDDVRARLGLGLCLRFQRRPADAEAILREAVRLQPGTAPVPT